VFFFRGECFLPLSNVTLALFDLRRIDGGGEDVVFDLRLRFLLLALDMLELPSDCMSSFFEFVFDFFCDFDDFFFEDSLGFSELLCPDFAFLAPDLFLGVDSWFLVSPEDFFRLAFFDFWALE
jgi:hypothetical protein